MPRRVDGKIDPPPSPAALVCVCVLCVSIFFADCSFVSVETRIPLLPLCACVDWLCLFCLASVRTSVHARVCVIWYLMFVHRLLVLAAMLHVGCSLKLGNGAVLGVKDAFGKCKGLNIASVAKTTSYDVMKDGSIIHPWDGVPQANLATADEYDRQFYITKDGVPLYFNNVTVHHANPYMKHKGYVIKPTLQNDGGQSIAVSDKPQGPISNVQNGTFTAHLQYGHCRRQGQPYVWITFEIFKDTGVSGPAAKGLMETCGISPEQCQGNVCVRFSILWAKQCPKKRHGRQGLSVGTSSSARDVVENGMAVGEFNVDTPTYYVTKDTQKTKFFVWVKGKGEKGDMGVVLGKPTVQGFAENQLIVTQGGTAGQGGVIMDGSRALTLEMNFECVKNTIASQQRITVGIDVCKLSTNPAECSLSDSDSIEYQSVMFSILKYCGEDPGGTFAYHVFLVFFFLSLFGCVTGCFYKHRVLGSRNIEMLPGVDILRSCATSLAGIPCLKQCLTPGIKYSTLEGHDEGIDDFDDESFIDDGINDSSIGYQSSVSIGMARRGEYGELDEDELDLQLDEDINADDF